MRSRVKKSHLFQPLQVNQNPITSWFPLFTVTLVPVPILAPANVLQSVHCRHPRVAMIDPSPVLRRDTVLCRAPHFLHHYFRKIYCCSFHVNAHKLSPTLAVCNSWWISIQVSPFQVRQLVKMPDQIHKIKYQGESPSSVFLQSKSHSSGLLSSVLLWKAIIQVAAFRKYQC